MNIPFNAPGRQYPILKGEIDRAIASVLESGWYLLGEELRFRNTHPLTHQYILDNFERLPDSLSPAYQISRDKGNTQ